MVHCPPIFCSHPMVSKIFSLAGLHPPLLPQSQSPGAPRLDQVYPKAAVIENWITLCLVSSFVNVKHSCLLLLKITKLVLMIFHQWWETSTTYKDSFVTASQLAIINLTEGTAEEIQLSGMHYHIPRLLYYHVSGCTFPWAWGMVCLTSSVPVNWRGVWWVERSWNRKLDYHGPGAPSPLTGCQFYIGREPGKTWAKVIQNTLERTFSGKVLLLGRISCSGNLKRNIPTHRRSVSQIKHNPFISTKLRHVALSPILCCHPQYGQLAPSSDRQQLDRCGWATREAGREFLSWLGSVTFWFKVEIDAATPLGSQFAVEYFFPERRQLETGHR